MNKLLVALIAGAFAATAAAVCLFEVVRRRHGAERRIEPTLPGSCTSSSSRQKSEKAESAGRGVTTTANNPTLAGSEATPAKSDSETTSVRSPWRSTNVRAAGLARAASVTISVSGAP